MEIKTEKNVDFVILLMEAEWSALTDTTRAADPGALVGPGSSFSKRLGSQF